MKYALSPIEFKDVYNSSESIIIHDLLFKYTYNETPKLGFIVSRKYGNSVQRNLFKRRCRYAFYKLIKEEGLLVGGSSGGAVWAALQEAEHLESHEKCLVILPDSIRNYLSKFIDDDWMKKNFS